jgi:hypothetical protein
MHNPHAHEDTPASNPKRAAKVRYRQGLTRGPVFGLIPLTVFVVLYATVLYGQSSDQALFIDQNGNVGIGNPTAQNLLHVGSGTSTIMKDRVNAVIASKTQDAGIAIAQKDNVNVLLQAAGAGGYIGTTSNHPLTLRTNNADRFRSTKMAMSPWSAHSQRRNLAEHWKSTAESKIKLATSCPWEQSLPIMEWPHLTVGSYVMAASFLQKISIRT